MKKPHTSTNKGKRVLIRLKNGLRLIGKFGGSSHTRVVIDNKSISIDQIKSFSIYKQKQPLDRIY